MTILGQRSFGDLGAPLWEVPFCVLDLETTGVGADRSEITEIGAIRYDGGRESGRFQTLVNPGTGIPPRVTVLTGITQAMVIDAPRIEAVLPAFLEFLGDAVIVGHNVSFDISFLNAAAIRLGYGRLPNRSADTLSLARRLIRRETRSLKLSALAAHLGSPTVPNHRALDDAIATAHVFWSLLERAGSIGVTHLDDLLALPTIRGSRAIGKLALTEDLPRKPGVYRFVDANGKVLYVGKATNLRARVRSYFGGDTRRRIDDLLRDTASISHRMTINELEAAVVEVREIHDANPPHNRRSRQPKSLHWVRLTDERHPRFQLARTADRGRLDLGPFRSRKAAEQVLFALWDGSRIRRCSGRGRGCSFSDLGVAVCPCTGAVSDTDYAAIVDRTIAAIDLDPSPMFDRIETRMATLAAHQRFEDAAAVRDRRAALARTLTQRRVWQSLQAAGRFVAVDGSGVCAAVDRGHLEACWERGTTAPLSTARRKPQPNPSSMAALDEAMLVWRWIDQHGPSILEISGTLALSAHRIPELDHARSRRHASGGRVYATAVPGPTRISGTSSTTPSGSNAPMTRTSDR